MTDAHKLAAVLTDMTVTVRKDKVYGNIVYYPVCAKAKLFAEIGKTRTIIAENLGKIEQLGFHVEITHS